ncbi:NAD(P)H-binding protein [Rhizobium leguminosarum]|uniref:NAD(P)H-binding protein n=1 Tax=Rhizobium leguminosarum TaxID=384 RepID=UPI003CFE65EB
MGSYIVVGAGPVGRETARLLAEEGHQVTLTSRNVGSADAGVRTVSADATDAEALARLGDGADAIFMCAMAAYHRWPTDFFPILDGTVQAAETVGAKLLIVGNVYGYGQNAPNPLTAEGVLDPTTRKGTVRAIMWERALRSKVPALEIRPGDYLGSGAVTYFGLLALPSLLKGTDVGFLGSFDEPHAWSYTKDVARTLVAASKYEGAWDRAFMAPVQHATVRELVTKVAAIRNLPVPDMKILPPSTLEAIGAGEMIEMSYQFEKPLLVDASETETLLKVAASDLDEMLEDTLREFK